VVGADGHYLIVIMVYDFAGNVKRLVLIIIVDTSPPVIVDVKYPSSVMINEKVTIEAWVYDDLSGVDRVILTYWLSDEEGTNVTMELIGDHYYATILCKCLGTLKFKLFAIDYIGNAISSSEYTIVVEKPPEKLPMLHVLMLTVGCVGVVAIIFILLWRNRFRLRIEG